MSLENQWLEDAFPIEIVPFLAPHHPKSLENVRNGP